MRVILLLGCLGAIALAQSKSAAAAPQRMEITLERREGTAWKAVDPGTVLDGGDRVRFRFRANFTGFLYVTNSSTGGHQTLLYPRTDTGGDNRVLPGKEYVVPATQGAFRVAGPAGYDVVSWTVSPVELGRPAEPAAVSPEPPPGMKPRCDETLMRARGECVDTAAGPKAGEDLMVIRGRGSSVVASTVPLRSPVVYEFRLAHR